MHLYVIQNETVWVIDMIYACSTTYSNSFGYLELGATPNGVVIITTLSFYYKYMTWFYWMLTLFS